MMKSPDNYIEYEADTTCLSINDFSHEIHIEGLFDIIVSLSTSNDILKIRAKYVNVYTNDNNLIEKETGKVVGHFVELLELYFNQHIPVPIEKCKNLSFSAEVIKSYLEGDTVCAVVSDQMCVSLGVRIKMVRCMIEDDRDRLKHFLDENLNKLDTLWHEYLAAIACPDSTGRYMLLYMILSQLCGEGYQHEIDSAIREIEPGVPVFEAPQKENKKPKKETLYTKVRNQIGHKRVGVEEAKKDAARYVHALQSIVKRMIQKHIEAEKCLPRA
jgi:hypothetical protein